MTDDIMIVNESLHDEQHQQQECILRCNDDDHSIVDNDNDTDDDTDEIIIFYDEILLENNSMIPSITTTTNTYLDPSLLIVDNMKISSTTSSTSSTELSHEVIDNMSSTSSSLFYHNNNVIHSNHKTGANATIIQNQCSSKQQHNIASSSNHDDKLNHSTTNNSISNKKKKRLVCLSIIGIILLIIIIIGLWLLLSSDNNKNNSRTNNSNNLDNNNNNSIIINVPTEQSLEVLSLSPSTLPSYVPTYVPSFKPITARPITLKPSTIRPTISNIPSYVPTISSYPSIVPSILPTLIPSDIPTLIPSSIPSMTPTLIPSYIPSLVPTSDLPSVLPTNNPTLFIQHNSTIFCVIGDVPYTDEQAITLREQMLYDLPNNDAEFMVHVGDIRHADHRCEQDQYTNVAQILQLSHIPVFVLLGDNDWNDCSNMDDGLIYWKNEFLNFDMKYWNSSLLVSSNLDGTNEQEQGIIERPFNYPMNFAFIRKNTLFIGLNLVGKPIKDIHEWYTRLSYQSWWTMKLIRQYNISSTINNPELGKRVVIFGHADPESEHDDYFKPLRVFIKDELRNTIPILYIHGDNHKWLYEPNYLGLSSFLRIMVTAYAEQPPLQITINNDPNITNVEDVFILG